MQADTVVALGTATKAYQFGFSAWIAVSAVGQSGSPESLRPTTKLCTLGFCESMLCAYRYTQSKVFHPSAIMAASDV